MGEEGLVEFRVDFALLKKCYYVSSLIHIVILPPCLRVQSVRATPSFLSRFFPFQAILPWMLVIFMMLSPSPSPAMAVGEVVQHHQVPRSPLVAATHLSSSHGALVLLYIIHMGIYISLIESTIQSTGRHDLYSFCCSGHCYLVQRYFPIYQYISDIFYLI